MEDSPRHNQRIKKFPSMDQQDFNLLNHPRKIENFPNKRIQAEPQTSRDHLRDRDRGADRGNSYNSPLMKYSSILNE